MQILEAVLASALVLLSFATIVTIIMEIVLKVLGIKAKGFEEIAKAMFNDVLLDRFKKQLKTMKGLKGTKLEEEKERIFKDFKKFVSTKNISPLDSEKKKGLLGFLAAKLLMKRRTKPDNVGVEDFFEKLAESEIGMALFEKAKNNLDNTIADLAKKYERLGSEVREDFIRNSAFMTQVFGILLAFALNLNVFTFFTTFMSDPELTQEIIAQQEELLKNYKAQENSLQDEINKNGGVQDNQIAQPSPEEEKQNREKAEKNLTETQGTITKLQEDLSGLRKSLDSDLYNSLPMGYDNFPYCVISCGDPQESLLDIFSGKLNFENENPIKPETTDEIENGETDDQETAEENENEETDDLETAEENEDGEVDSHEYSPRTKATLFLIPWVLSILLTGILIGLGGPFWYNFVVKLSGIVQTVRGKAPAPKPATGASHPAAGREEKSPLVEQYSTAIDAFKLASENLPPPKK